MVIPYGRLIAVGSALFIAASLFLYGKHVGVVETELSYTSKMLQQSEASRERENALQEKIANTPKAQHIIREIIRENPSNCIIPQPVADGLRDAIRKSNTY